MRRQYNKGLCAVGASMPPVSGRDQGSTAFLILLMYVCHPIRIRNPVKYFSYLANMFSRLFGRRNKEDSKYDDLPAPATANWGALGADMHSHFLPGIDDGAKNIDDSLLLLRTMADMGYKTIITTPHVMIDYYPNTTQTIQTALLAAQNVLKENNIDIQLRAAAEYYIDDYFTQLIEKEPLLTIHKNEVLVEFSMLYEPPMLGQALFSMQTNGYKPIIAHPERYMFFHRDLSKYSELKDRGCLLQLNMLSIAGYYGQNIKNVAEQLLAKGLYDYCGSDAHHEKHLAVLRAMACSKDYHRITGYPFLNSRLCL
jgi:tyrosine-protein phosphatase YwqE